jgi:hypothetical protein
VPWGLFYLSQATADIHADLIYRHNVFTCPFSGSVTYQLLGRPSNPPAWFVVGAATAQATTLQSTLLLFTGVYITSTSPSKSKSLYYIRLHGPQPLSPCLIKAHYSPKTSGSWSNMSRPTKSPRVLYQTPKSLRLLCKQTSEELKHVNTRLTVLPVLVFCTSLCCLNFVMRFSSQKGTSTRGQ